MRAATLLLVVLVVQCSLFASAQSLKSYNVDLNQTTTSGISAGAFMAVQFHVAFSNTVKGAAVVAGGPFACALGSMTTALTSCMSAPAGINMNTLYNKANGLSSQIDPLSNLQGHKVYVYDGTKDSVVRPGVGQKGADWYSHYGANVKSIQDMPSQHAWITNNYGSNCGQLKSPYINNCDYDQASDILSWFYGTLNPSVAQKSQNLFEFDQSDYTSSGDSMGNTGYVYVPTSCQQNATCRVHVAFHGCKMTLADIGTDFVENSGLNEVAEANNIIVLYPQAKKSLLSPSNPNGCFDWWGYTCNKTPLQTSLKYVTKQGAQMQVVYAEISQLAGKPFTITRDAQEVEEIVI